jgi:histidine ammonia-lyase
MLCERQLNFMLNDKLNGKFPPFVNLGTLGLNLGMQGVQFTATSTTAENQTLCFPMYVHSIPSNNDNQDIVSMGANAALIAQKVIFNTYEVLAVELLTIAQAIDYSKVQDKISACGLNYYLQLRAIAPVFEQDSIKYKVQLSIVNYLKELA